MGLVSIEDAVLGFVRKVKADPGLTDLFRDALHELEHALDPDAAEQEPTQEPEAAPPEAAAETPGDGTEPSAAEPDQGA